MTSPFPARDALPHSARIKREIIQYLNNPTLDLSPDTPSVIIGVARRLGFRTISKKLKNQIRAHLESLADNGCISGVPFGCNADSGNKVWYPLPRVTLH